MELPISRCTDNENVVRAHKGILSICKERQNYEMYRKVDDPESIILNGMMQSQKVRNISLICSS